MKREIFSTSQMFALEIFYDIKIKVELKSNVQLFSEFNNLFKTELYIQIKIEKKFFLAFYILSDYLFYEKSWHKIYL